MTEVYKIGVNIAMASNGSALLGVLARDLLNVHTKVGDLEKGFGRLKMAIVGALSVAAGVGIIAAFKGPLDEAAKMQTAVARFARFGMGDMMNQQAEKWVRAQRIMGSSTTELMDIFTEAQGVFRESGGPAGSQLLGAQIMAPILAKMRFAQNALGMKPQSQEDEMMMLRFIEARGGANDPAKAAAISDWAFKLLSSSGGSINWGDLRSLVKNAGAGGFNLTESAISKLEPVLTDMGGGTVGSGMRVAFQRLLGTQRMLPKQAIEEYLSLGFWDPTKVELSGSGGIRRFKGNPGSVFRDSDQFMTDPVQFYTDTFLPAIAKKYGNQILGDTVAAKTQRAAEIAMVFGPGTAGNTFSQIDKLLPAIQRSQRAQNIALGYDAASKAGGATLKGQEIALQKNWQTLMLQLGDHVLPLAVKGMTWLNSAIEKIGMWAQTHQKTVDVIVKGFLILGAALIGLGTALVAIAAFAAAVTAGPIALLVAGIGALVGAITAFAILNWDGIVKTWKGFTDAISGFFNWLIHGDGKLGPGNDWTNLGKPNGGRGPAVPAGGYGGHSGSVGHVYIDGKKAGAVIFHGFSRAANGPSNGMSTFDPSRSYSPVSVPQGN